MIGIYKITSPNGKIYIGQSTNIEHRLKAYKRIDCKTQPKLFKSLIKYGYINHKFDVLKECSIDELNYYERYYQEVFDSNIDGLNCILTKTLDKTGLMSIESRKKMSKSRTGIKRPKSLIDKLKIINTGSKRSLESRKKMSEAQKGKKRTLESRLKQSISSKGRAMSEINKQNIKALMSKKVINTVTGEIHSSATFCAKKNNFNYKSFVAKLNNQNKNNTNFKYI